MHIIRDLPRRLRRVEDRFLFFYSLSPFSCAVCHCGYSQLPRSLFLCRAILVSPSGTVARGRALLPRCRACPSVRHEQRRRLFQNVARQVLSSTSAQRAAQMLGGEQRGCSWQFVLGRERGIERETSEARTGLALFAAPVTSSRISAYVLPSFSSGRGDSPLPVSTLSPPRSWEAALGIVEKGICRCLPDRMQLCASELCARRNSPTWRSDEAGVVRSRRAATC